jgi:hypothetical protein
MSPRSASPHAVLELDSSLRRISWGGQSVALSGRWDAAFLHALVAGRFFGPGRAGTAHALERAMAPFGLRGALTATQWSRIVERVRAALLVLDPSGGWARRLSHPPRGKTTGPWWWVLGADEVAPVLVGGELTTPIARAAAGSHTPAVPDALALAPSIDSDAPARLIAELKLALEAMWKADPKHALDLLADHARWKGESTALSMLRRLRRAEVLQSLGAHSRAERLLDSLGSERNDELLTRLFASHVRLARMRVAYASNPVGNYAALRRELRQTLAGRAARATDCGDGMAWAEKLHLLALCERRALEHETEVDAVAEPDPSRLNPMLRAAHAALLLFLLARCYDRAQHVCANLAYAHQKLAPRLGEPHWALAVRWHELSFGMHAAFGGAENSAWEYIYLGEFWLDSPQARAACRRPGRGASWDDHTPDHLAFYDRGCRIAAQLGDPRQIAYTLLNRYRFALHAGPGKTRDEALRRLRAHLRAHPDLVRPLEREGYVLPK